MNKDNPQFIRCENCYYKTDLFSTVFTCAGRACNAGRTFNKAYGEDANYSYYNAAFCDEFKPNLKAKVESLLK